MVKTQIKKKNSNRLTVLQTKFCHEYLKLGVATQAYKNVYPNAHKYSVGTIVTRSRELTKNPKIIKEIKRLNKELEKETIYTLSDSVKRDLKILEEYEKALYVIVNPNTSKQDLALATRVIKTIGNRSYNAIQDRLSKQHGFFKIDNSQKINKMPEMKIINLSQYNNIKIDKVVETEKIDKPDKLIEIKKINEPDKRRN